MTKYKIINQEWSKAMRCLLFCFCVGFSGLFSQEMIVAEGAIRIGNSEAAFPDPGTIRWTGSDFQVHNGYMWVSLTSGVAYTGEVTDIDGNVYPTIRIGDQEWMAENLRTGKYKDGSTIPQVTGNTAWSNASDGAWCRFDNNNLYDRPYGKLYNWFAVADGRGLCPTGWHVPKNVSDWSNLEDFLGGQFVAGGLMKEAGIAHWDSPNTGATNASGFTGLGGGYRTAAGTFWWMGVYGYWWSQEHQSATDAWFREMYNGHDEFNAYSFDKKHGMSVRCVKD